MPILPEQLADELRGVVRGRVTADELTRGLYATDASPFYIRPSLVVVPEDEDDLRELLRYAYEHGVPIVPRGAGTGLAGESLGSGILVDLSTNFRSIGPIENDRVTVAAGVTLAELNLRLASRGRRFLPDPESRATCTLGGMIATNASGGTSFGHGTTRDHVLSLQGLLDDGQRFDTSDFIPPERISALRALILENRELIESQRPRLRFDRCGYALHELLTVDALDVTKLLVGSEGTLAVVTSAVLQTVPLAGGTAILALGFSTLDDALQAGPILRGLPGLIGCDVLDQRLLSMAKHTLIPASVGAMLIGQIEGETMAEARALGQKAVAAVRDSIKCVEIQEPTCDPEEIRRIHSFRESAVTGLYALGQGRRPEAFVEDVAVPEHLIAEYVAKVQERLRSDGVNASFLIHLLTGQVHTRPILDINDPQDREIMWPLADFVHNLAMDLAGTISSQHGVGIARTPWVEKQRAALMPVFRELKRIFDPKSILNPGKILGPDPSRPAWPMMPIRTADGKLYPSPLLLWENSSPHREASKCNGCGDCRPRSGAHRMCPIFRATGIEQATPRAKANAIRLTDPSVELASEEMSELSKYCVNCKMCRQECKAHVNIPKLMLEAKAAHYEESGFRRHEWMLARTESLIRLASQFSWTINTLLRFRPSRWMIEKFFGLSRHRNLPRLTHRTFLRRAWWSGLTRLSTVPPGTKKIAYFVDVFTNYCDTSIGEATVAVLKHHGFEVHVPWRQRGSGMTPLTYGDVESARDSARYNIRALAELVRDGYRIVCTEPAATLALSQDYRDLLDDADTILVAENTVDVMTILNELHEHGQLKPTTRELPVGIGHHVPCHVKALGGERRSPELLKQIKGMQIETIDAGCSGMAGTWGLAERNRMLSFEVGADMIAALDRPKLLFGSTECSACRLQMQDTTGKRTLHPIQWLAIAYGLIDIDLEA